MMFALFCATPLIPKLCAEEKPVESWSFEKFTEGQAVKGSAGLALTPVGTVVPNEGAADFSGGGYFFGKQGLASFAGESFSIVAMARLMVDGNAGYGTIFMALPEGTLRMHGRTLGLACGKEWHAIEADKGLQVLDRWTQVAATFDGSVYRLYLDGALLGEHEPAVKPAKGNSFSIGGRPASGGQSAEADAPIESFPGLIKWVKIFDAAVTPEQLKAMK
jgi:hypothetical protein